jgi:pimeloyl-ACP methyl ester carboxylesterase
MDAVEFADAVREVCEQLGVMSVAAAVGVSFGGLQAVHVAGHRSIGVERLVLHSSASTLPYPDTRADAVLGRVAFAPGMERTTWWLVRQAVRTEPGLRAMLARLSRLPAEQWWDDLTAADKERAQGVFNGMGSGSGFSNDLRQAQPGLSGARRAALERVTCPALVTASPHDGGIDRAHAADLHEHLADSALVELPSPTHLFWIGPGRDLLSGAVRDFLKS